MNDQTPSHHSTPQRSSIAEPRISARMKVRFGDSQGKLLTDFSVNLNSGGIFIETDRLMPPGTLLFLEFELPLNGCKMNYKARVAWVNSFSSMLKQDLPVGMGVQFIDLSFEDLSPLRQYISSKNILSDW
jgi:uncharacterized protein (TIGR02266 family)